MTDTRVFEITAVFQPSGKRLKRRNGQVDYGTWYKGGGLRSSHCGLMKHERRVGSFFIFEQMCSKLSRDLRKMTTMCPRILFDARMSWKSGQAQLALRDCWVNKGVEAFAGLHAGDSILTLENRSASSPKHAQIQLFTDI